MNRADIDAIKASLVDPLDVARRLGLDTGAKRQAGGLSIFCPSHDEHTPSCSLTSGPDGTLRVKCFGCGFGGDLFSLVAAVERLDLARDFVEVKRRAAELAHVDLDQVEARAPMASRAAPAPACSDEDFAAVASPLLYLGRLDDSGISADVCSYLDARGLLQLAQAEGWAALPPAEFQATWARMLTEAAQPIAGCDSPFDAAELRGCGLLSRDGFAHPDARLLIPWRDPTGRVYSVQRRRLDAGTPKYVGAAGRALRWPYGIERLAFSPLDAPIVLVEGAIDVLALRAILAERGEAAVVLGLPGLAGWRAEWAELAADRLAVVAVDTDDAGERHVMQIAGDLAAAGAVVVKRWKAPGKDWAESIGARVAPEAAS